MSKDYGYPRPKYHEQIHNQVLMLAESLGTEPTFAIKEQSIFDHMLVSAATFSSDLAREKYLILVGTPYRLQVENAFDYRERAIHPPTKDRGMNGPNAALLTTYLFTVYNRDIKRSSQFRLTGQARALLDAMSQADGISHAAC